MDELPYNVVTAADKPWATQRDLDFLKSAIDFLTRKFLSGSATVLNGNTTVVVTHNYGSTSYRTVVTPVADPGARVWISARNANDFTINVGAAVGADTVFDWILKGD